MIEYIKLKICPYLTDKGESALTFSEFAKLLYPFCGNGETPSNFLVALFGAVSTETDDPLFDKKGDSLKRIYEGKKRVTKKSASYILSHLEKSGFDTYLYDLVSDDALVELCGRFEPYVGNATKDDISTKIADLFVSILEEIAKGTPTTSLTVTAQTSFLPSLLSANVDSILLSEVSMRCPSCGNLLMRKTNGQTVVGDYRVTEIYPSAPSAAQAACLASIVKPTAYSLNSTENKTVLCLTCNNDYLSVFTPVLYNRLLENKLGAVALFDAVSRIDKVSVERSLSDIVSILAGITDADLASLLRFEALKVDAKILPSNVLLKNKIKNYATMFYLYIEELIAREATANSVVGNRLPQAVQFASDDLIASGLSQPQVFAQMTQ